MYAGALFIQMALQWNIYLAVTLLLSITALYTVAGDPPDGLHQVTPGNAAQCLSSPCSCVPQVVWRPSSTPTLLRRPSCWWDPSSSWASVSQTWPSHDLASPPAPNPNSPPYSGFDKVGGWEALMEGYGNAVPAIRVPNTTCGIPRDDAFHLFRDPVNSDLPWPGVILGMSIPSLWYWCSDQVHSRKKPQTNKQISR